MTVLITPMAVTEGSVKIFYCLIENFSGSRMTPLMIRLVGGISQTIFGKIGDPNGLPVFGSQI